MINTETKNCILKKISSRQIILYGLFGLLTSVVNLFLFWALLELKLPYKTANLITLIVVKIVSYVVNRIWVFKSNVTGFLPVVKEFLAFMATRGLTMLIDFFGVIFLVDVFALNPKISKYAMIIVVVVINYFFGQTVFSKSNEKGSHEQDEKFTT